MPLFTSTMRTGRRDADKAAVSAAIGAASVSAGSPQNNMFQRLFSLEADDLLVDPTCPGLPKPRSDELLMIETLVSSGTTAQQKHAVLAALIAQLKMVGADGNGLVVLFDRASSSFGNGTPALPIVIG